MAFSRAPAQSSLPGMELPSTPSAFSKNSAYTDYLNQVTPDAQYTPPTKFSEEQMAIIHSNARVTAGQAFAGTGKSTTGIGYAMHHPDKNILVLCFNRANAIEAAAKYPAVSTNVTVGTTHAVARRFLSSQMNARVATRWSSVTLRSELPIVGARGDMRTAAVTANILRDFFMSADEKIDPVKHGRTARRENLANTEMISQCCEYAWRLWLAMNTEDVLPFMRARDGINPISIPHDAYLKRFVMMGGNLGYDTIIFDEAQDANPIMLKLLENQYTTGTNVLLLGDRHQAIYEFRGAVNAMENLPDDARILPLTQSWRFGPKTAAIANLLLGELKNEKLQIQGLGQDGYYEEGKDPITYLSRTNADLIERAVACEGDGVYWVGGIEGYRVTVLEDAWRLRCGKVAEIRDPYISRNFRSWSEFQDAAEYDNESRILYKLVEQYGAQIPDLVKKLHENAAPTQESATMTVATAHKSKGLEWDYVKLSNDFEALEQAERWLAGDDVKFPEQEINLMYVACTRAKKRTVLNREIYDWCSNLKDYRKDRVRTYSPEQMARDEEGGRPKPDGSANTKNPRARGPFAKAPQFRAKPR